MNKLSVRFELAVICLGIFSSMACAQCEIFVSYSGFGEGNARTNTELNGSVGDTVSAYIWVDENFEVDTGMFINVRSTVPGVIQFLPGATQVFEPDIILPGPTVIGRRWSHVDSWVVLPDSVERLNALAGCGTDASGILTSNNGIPLDELYDPAEAAFLYARVDFEILDDTASTEITCEIGCGLIVNNNDGECVELNPCFGSTTVVGEKTGGVETCAGDDDDFQPGDVADTPFQRHPFDDAILWEHNNHNGPQGPNGRNFDQLTFNHTFGHSFVDLPVGQIDLTEPVLLKIEFRCEDSAINSTDSIGLQLRDEDMPALYPGPLFSPPMSWGQNLPDFVDTYGNGEPCDTGVLTTVDLRTLVATSGSLSGLTIAETINQLGHLDIFVGDDTGIDYICLCYSPVECTFESDNVLCRIIEDQLTEDFVVTGTFTNLQDIPGTHILLPPDAISPAGVELCFGGIPGPFGEFGTTQVLQLDMPLSNGDSFEIGANPSNEGAIIIKNAMPGDEVCFRLVLLGDNGVECCTVEVCFEMPPCDCLQVDRRHDQISEGMCSIDLDGNTFISFDYTFQLTNLFGQNVYHAFLAPLGTETFFPDYFDLELINAVPVGHGESVELMTHIRTTNLPAGEVVNFLITIHNEDFSECCSREHSVVIPEGCVLLPSTKNLPGDVNEDGEVDLTDVQPFVDLLTTGGYSVNADVNQDCVVNLTDVAPFVSLLSGN